MSKIGKQFKGTSIKELSLDSSSRTISGYAAIFGNRDKAGDILVKGCFSKSISERGPESKANDKIIFLWMHDMSEPVGRITRLVEDDKGLYFEAVIDRIPQGDRIIEQLESGTLNQFSIGYKYVYEKREWDKQQEAYIVKEVVLYEISVVSIGCNGETQYLGLKSDIDLQEAQSQLQKDIDKTLKGLPIKTISELQGLFSKTWTLASSKPDKGHMPGIPLAGDQAGQGKKSFYSIKFKNQNCTQ